MTDKELTEWEHQSHVITVLTSREMGAWLGRRDNRLLQEIRQEIADIPIPYDDKDTLEHQYGEGLIRDAVIEIIDKHIPEIERSDTE